MAHVRYAVKLSMVQSVMNMEIQQELTQIMTLPTLAQVAQGVLVAIPLEVVLATHGAHPIVALGTLSMNMTEVN